MMEVNNLKLKRARRQEAHLLGTLVLFLFSYGCTIFSGLSEPEVKPVESPTAPAYEQLTEPVVSAPPKLFENENNRAVASLKKPLSKQEIRQIQARLKAVGFDPGPIDGILGRKTRSVLLQVQAGCTIVNELVAASDMEIVAPAVDIQGSGLTGSVNTLTKEEIELLQKRLKAVGLDPGPIDGILGSRTRLAISRCKSGCVALNDLLGSSDKRVPRQTSEIPSAPVSAAAKSTALVSNVSSKQEIRRAQERLRAAGFDPGPIDGILGPKTSSALEKYRSSHKFTRSGLEALLDY
jgi:peptidoglycan hydrolase-like protein with peptidoglycan-binding domain